jgi:cell fate (sporulation/competence/biofilm development) regulator YmcA (YheA/YmcA/DUF963 family)
LSGDFRVTSGCFASARGVFLAPVSGFTSGEKKELFMSRFSIVRQDQFIHATRDSGYKGTDSALSELIDNSIQANATRVRIRILGEQEESSGPGRRKMARVSDVAVCDNGRGMDDETLRRALRFGDGTRFNDRGGLGRFGMGLPNASVSQCCRFEVYTWQKGGSPHYTYVDVDEVADRFLEEVPAPIVSELPPEFRDLADSPSGTLVIWRKCDRIDHDGKVDTLERSLRHDLGRMFRYFLAGDFSLAINGQEVKPFDPLFLLPQARFDSELLAAQHGDKVEFDVRIPGTADQTSKVEVVFSLLPESWQTDAKGDKDSRKSRYIDATAGFSIVRHGREIDLIKSPYHAKHWTDAWYRVELRFEPELDEVFGVTHTKQHARITAGSSLYEQLKPLITANVATMKDMIIARGKRAHLNKTLQAEEMAKRVESRLKPLEEIERKSDGTAAEEIRSFVEQQAATKSLSSDDIHALEERLDNFPIIMEFEALPGAPFYRTRVVGCSIVISLNTEHAFYEKVYRRIQVESPIAKTGIDLMLMSIARSEIQGSGDCREWYTEQRHEWSQNLRILLGQIEELDPAENGHA